MEKATQKKKLLSIGKAAEYLNISIDTLRRWEKKGKVDSYRSPGNHRYFLKEDLDKLFGKKYQHDAPRKKVIVKKVPDEPTVKDSTQDGNVEKVENDIPKITPSYAQPTVYPSFTPPQPESIIDRPAREVKIPEIELIKIVQTQRQVEIASNGTHEAEIEQNAKSILTPKLEEPSKEQTTDRENGEKIGKKEFSYQENKKDVIKGPEKDVEKETVKEKEVKEQKEKSEDLKTVKNNLLIYAIITITILIVIATIFFVIGVSSQQMISPVP